ncbi:MAG: tRNA pseudouridine(54/55) synthase Pus10 [Candidatus Micrarchaeota archaeon]
MRLCSMCNLANGNRFEEGECYICNGAALKTEGMIAQAATLLVEKKAKSFSISTNIDKEWLAREEKAFDERMKDAESMKNFLNRRISAALSKASGAGYGAEGECKIVFDYAKGAVELREGDLFVFGRYRKRTAGLSQSRWICPRCEGRGCNNCQGKGKYYESVEERIGEPLMKAAQAQAYTMHASGREDVDATNSAGRPFVLELNAAKIRELDLGKISAEIAASGEVEAIDLAFVQRSFVEVVTESHFDKTYDAEVEFEKDVGDTEMIKIRTLEGVTLLQQTPTRVAHRRADLIRHRKIKHIEAIKREGQDALHATLIVRAEAGTYIKELISGDNGRTNPSVSGLLGMKAKCTKLEVTGIDDSYLDLCRMGQSEWERKQALD